MSNVYYLPVPAASAIDVVGALPMPRPTWRQKVTRAVARLRFALREFHRALRGPTPVDLGLELRAASTPPDARERAIMMDHAALLGVRVAPSAPARIFDFAAARARMR
jgi:hypothetical protein